MLNTWLVAGISKEALTEVVFFGEQVLIDMFNGYNIAASYSDAVERLSSKGKDI